MLERESSFDCDIKRGHAVSKITAIQKLSKYGIFHNYTDKDTKNFGRLNLFYGWNGSGKSTLSTIFETLQNKKDVYPGRFAQGDYVVATEEGPITPTTVGKHTLNIQTFNQNFIKNNIDWDKSIKGILLVAKEKIEEKKELDELRKSYERTKETVLASEKSLREKEDALSKFLTDSAKRTKTSLQVIDTKDSRYLNYNKTKLEEFISNNVVDINKDEALLSSTEIIALTKSARPDLKPRIEITDAKIGIEKFATAHQRLIDLLKSSATNAAIDRLSNNGDIQTWVSAGLQIHQQHESSTCEFCGSIFTPERKKKLEAHFNEAFTILQQRLVKANEWLLNQYVSIDGFPQEADLYEELRGEFSVAIGQINSSAKNLNFFITEWHDVLKKKISNQFDISLSVSPIPTAPIEELNTTLQNAYAIIKKHNQKTQNFDAETRISKQRLELHYAASEVRDFNYFEKLKKVGEEKKKQIAAKPLLIEQSEKILKLQNSLSSEGIGAEQFNIALHKFLGRTELSLRFKPESSGYEIIRNSVGNHDANLSEGEKTAIAFIYFITKLNENDNKIENTIVVIDDPISSFDSNHLFYSYSFLRNHCANAKQLFVLTHNFNFYKLIRDWFEGTNRNKANRNKGDTSPVAFFYIIESNNENPRSSSIKNAKDNLTKYHSEYHYLFSRLYEYKEQDSLSMEESFLVANISRKLLETFFTFKHPKHRSDISALLREGQKNCTETTPVAAESIYRFINKYSHNDVVEMNYDAAENLQGESHNIIGAIFTWMNEVDPTHFEEMKQVASGE